MQITGATALDVVVGDRDVSDHAVELTLITRIDDAAEARLSLHHEVGRPELRLADAIGAAGSFGIAGTALFAGVVIDVAFSKQRTELVLRSPLARLDGDRGFRGWVDATVGEVLTEELERAGCKVRHGDLPGRRWGYLLRYHERGRAFVVRQARAAGVAVMDRGDAVWLGATLPDDGPSHRLDPLGNDTIEGLSLRATLRPPGGRVSTFDPDAGVRTSAEAPRRSAEGAAGDCAERSAKHFEDPVAEDDTRLATTQRDVDEEAELRERMVDLVELRFNVASRVLRVGDRLELSGLPYPADVSGERGWVVHEASVTWRGGHVSSAVLARPASVPLAQQPGFEGPSLPRMERAEVTETEDPAGLGRVKLRFSSGPLRDAPGPWARVLTPSLGNDHGAWQLPQPGDEVMVTFEHGRALSPIVVGCLGHRASHAPFRSGAATDIWTLRFHDTEIYACVKEGAEHIDVVVPGARLTVRSARGQGGTPRIEAHVPDGAFVVRADTVDIEAREMKTKVRERRQSFANERQDDVRKGWFASAERYHASASEELRLDGREVHAEASEKAVFRGQDKAQLISGASAEVISPRVDVKTRGGGS